MSGYIARLIARNDPEAAFTSAPTPFKTDAQKSAPMMGMESEKTAPAFVDPLEMDSEIDALSAPPSVSNAPSDRERRSITPDASFNAERRTSVKRDVPPTPVFERNEEIARPLDIDFERTASMPPPRMTDEPEYAPAREIAPPDVLPPLRSETDSSAERSDSEPSSAPRRQESEQGEAVQPLESPWTFAELLAPFLGQLKGQDDASTRDADDERKSSTPIMPMRADDDPSMTRDQMPPLIEPDTAPIESTARQDTPSISIGDIVIEVTAPRPPAPPALRRAMASTPSSPPRLGVRSKRTFGMGQM